MKVRRLALGSVGVAVLGTISTAGPAGAQISAEETIVVDAVISDVPACGPQATPGHCTLAEAVRSSSADGLIQFSPALSSRLELDSPVIVDVPGLVIDGDNLVLAPGEWAGDSVLDIAADDVTIKDLEISGFETTPSGDLGGQDLGATAISIRAEQSGVTVTNALLHDNNANLVLETGESSSAPIVANHDQKSASFAATPGANGLLVTTPSPNPSFVHTTGEDAQYAVEVFTCDEDGESKSFKTATYPVPAETTLLISYATTAGERYSLTATDLNTGDTSPISDCSLPADDTVLPDPLAVPPGGGSEEPPGGGNEEPPDGGTGQPPSEPPTTPEQPPTGAYGTYGPYGPYEGVGPFGPFGPFGPPASTEPALL